MIDLTDMEAGDVAALASLVGSELVERDPALAAKTFNDLNVRADVALGERIVRRRLGQAHSQRAAVEKMASQVAKLHFVTIDAMMSDRKARHLVSARCHLAHALRNRLHLSLRDIARAMGSNRSTAMRQVRQWDAHIGGEREA